TRRDGLVRRYAVPEAALRQEVFSWFKLHRDEFMRRILWMCSVCEREHAGGVAQVAGAVALTLVQRDLVAMRPRDQLQRPVVARHRRDREGYVDAADHLVVEVHVPILPRAAGLPNDDPAFPEEDVGTEDGLDVIQQLGLHGKIVERAECQMAVD